MKLTPTARKALEAVGAGEVAVLCEKGKSRYYGANGNTIRGLEVRLLIRNSFMASPDGQKTAYGYELTPAGRAALAGE